MSPWRDDVARDEFCTLLAEILSSDDRRMPRTCPACKQSAIHAYLRADGDGQGTAWLWCSDCRCFLHEGTRIPAWWQDIDGIDPLKLVPALSALDALDEVRADIDLHWKRLSLRRTVSVVELRSLESPHEKPETWARFVLCSDGHVRVVGNTPNAKRYAEKITANGVPGPRGTYVKREAGLEFLQLLAENFRGSREWATRVF